MTGAVLDFGTQRRRRLLDELADLACGNHPLASGPVDVERLLQSQGETLSIQTMPVSVRLTPEQLADLDQLAERMADAGRPEARASGGHWGRAALLRVAVERGLRLIREDLDREAVT